MLHYSCDHHHRGGLTRTSLLLVVLVTLAAAPTPTSATIDPWGSYNRALEKRPLLTTCFTAATLMSVSDVTCQQFEPSTTVAVVDSTSGTTSSSTTTSTKKGLNQKRTLDVAITGFFWSAPIAHIWYTLLEQVVPPVQSKAFGVLIRLVLESIIWSPVMTFGYLTCRSVLEGASPMERLQQKFAKALVAGWKFWPALSAINYAVVPIAYRALYINLLSMVWNGYLTSLNSAQATTTTTCATTGNGKTRKEQKN